MSKGIRTLTPSRHVYVKTSWLPLHHTHQGFDFDNSELTKITMFQSFQWELEQPNFKSLFGAEGET